MMPMFGRWSEVFKVGRCSNRLTALILYGVKEIEWKRMQKEYEGACNALARLKIDHKGFFSNE